MGPVIGIDVGQKHDPTTLCVVELRLEPRGHRRESLFLVRHLEALPLQTPYPGVVQRISTVMANIQRHVGRAPIVYIDATGVGTPVLDMLRQEADHLGTIVPVQFVYGSKRELRNGSVRVGKRYLVRRLQALVSARRIRFGPNQTSEALIRELLNYEIRIDEKGRDRYGAFRSGTHDDLVTALALAVHVDPCK